MTATTLLYWARVDPRDQEEGVKQTERQRTTSAVYEANPLVIRIVYHGCCIIKT